MYAPCSKITIGRKALNGVNEVIITRSIYEPMAKATLKVPVTAVLKQSGQPPVKVETAREIKAGDAVRIELGYNGDYNLEFTGYVKRLNFSVPLEIECEDAFYLTRSRNVILQGKTTLKDALSACGLEVGYAADLTLSQLQVDNKPVSWVLGVLKKEYGLAIFFDMAEKVYAAEPFKVQGENVKYVLRKNVIEDKGLKYRLSQDVKLKIKAVCYYRDGSKVDAEIGEAGGAQQTLYFYDVTDAKQLKALAEAELKRYSYDGYQGRIETLLFPYAAPCMSARLTDENYPQRSGDYYIESVKTYFGIGGRREVHIGIRI